MKAPDKIYLNPDEEGDFFGGVWSQNKCDDNSVEYIRKDALLEWAKEEMERYRKEAKACSNMHASGKFLAMEDVIRHIDSL